MDFFEPKTNERKVKKVRANTQPGLNTLLDEPVRTTQMITIHADRVTEVKPGIFAVALDSRVISSGELEVLHDLVPDFMGPFFNLLRKQAILNAIIEEE